MEYDVRETPEYKWCIENPELYRKTVEFQNIMFENGISWHNHIAGECCSDFSCCTGLGSNKRYFPSYETVLKDEL